MDPFRFVLLIFDPEVNSFGPSEQQWSPFQSDDVPTVHPLINSALTGESVAIAQDRAIVANVTTRISSKATDQTPSGGLETTQQTNLASRISLSVLISVFVIRKQDYDHESKARF